MHRYYLIIGGGDEARLIRPHLPVRNGANHHAMIAEEAHDCFKFDHLSFDGWCVGVDWMKQLRHYLQRIRHAFRDAPSDPEVYIVRAVGRSDHWRQMVQQIAPVAREITGWKFGTVFMSQTIHPDHHNCGSIIHHRVHIGDRAKIGTGCILNTGAIIEHDAKIDTGAFIGPGAIILGGATVGAYSFVGAGCIVAPGASVPAEHFLRMGEHWTKKAGQ